MKNGVYGSFYMKSNEVTKEITNFDIISENIDSFTNDQQYLRRYEHKNESGIFGFEFIS